MEAKDLISRMLTVDSTKRLTAQGAMNHPWISGLTDEQLQAHDLNGTLTEIRKFNARRKLKGTIKAVMAATKMKRLLEGLTRGNSSMNLEDVEAKKALLQVEAAKTIQKNWRLLMQRRKEKGGAEKEEGEAADPEPTE